MNINTEVCSKTDLNKQPFNLKPQRKDGLVLKLHHTLPNKKQPIRFLHASFNSTGNNLAAANHNGDIFIIDFSNNKFWNVIRIFNNFIKFTSAENLLAIGLNDGTIRIVDVLNAEQHDLKGHDFSVNDVSFSNTNLCVSFSANEAVIWNLNKFVKIKILELDEGVVLKMAAFIPNSNQVLACFQDDSIKVWSADFKMCRFIQGVGKVKTFAITQNGKAIVFGGNTPNLTLFLLDIWSAIETIALPDCITGVKKLEFISHPFDGGANKILTALSGNGIVYFYNMEAQALVNKLAIENEVARFALCPIGHQIACVLNSGEVLIFNLSQYVGQKCARKAVKKIVQKKIADSRSQKQITEVLDMDKLKGILKEFGAYPDLYRNTIWINILKLPNNKTEYQTVLKNEYLSPFNNLEKIYPMENKQDLRNLKRTLNNLVSWCPFFAEVDFLPTFAFPFVRFFQNEPVICFEAIISIIVNYCQYWFEYHPLPPLNILGIIENVLLEQDPDLLIFLSSKQISSKLYAWPLLQSNLSEVLKGSEWLVFWDHVISNEPAFLLLSIVAFSLVNKNTLMACADLENFFRSQTPLDFKKFLSKTYDLLNETSETMHPRKYLERFKAHGDAYPIFSNFPKIEKEFGEELKLLKREEVDLLRSERDVMQVKINELEKVKMGSEEIIRMSELRKLYEEKLIQERASVSKQRERLQELKSKMQIETSVDGSKSCMNEVEKELIEQYTKILKYKLEIEGNTEAVETNQEIGKDKATSSKEYLKQLSVATGLAAMDSLINKVESEMMLQKSDTSKLKVNKLAEESNKLGEEINNLLGLLNKFK